MYFEEFTIGRRFALREVPIQDEKMAAFAREYDPLPIHLDEEYAKGTHFGRVIAPGVMSFMSVWRSFLDTKVLDEGLVAGIGTSIEWDHPVFAGDVLRGEAVVLGLEHKSAYTGIVEISVDAWNQDGRHVLRGVTKAVVKKRAGGNP